MADPRDADLERVRLIEDAARRLIQRATELDASLANQSSVAELREAARGAGISDEAFQRALDEVHGSAVHPVSPPQSHPLFRRRPFVAVLIVLIVAVVAIVALVSGRVRGGDDAVPAKFVPAAVQPTTPPSIAPATPVPVSPPAPASKSLARSMARSPGPQR